MSQPTVPARTRAILVLALTALSVAVVILLGPVEWRFSRHGFADRRTMLGIPNFLDVVSNAAFVLVGVVGFVAMARTEGQRLVDARERWPWLVLFSGVILVAFGSAYYHAAPDGDRLVWDRLPITIVFTAFFAAIVAERIGVGLGLLALAVLVPAGAGTVLYWASTGDLRPYMMVQLWPMLLVPLLVLGFPARYTLGHYVLFVLGFYVLAKGAELLDGQLLALIGVSGHSLKHAIAGAGLYPIVVMLRRRSATASLPAPSVRIHGADARLTRPS